MVKTKILSAILFVCLLVPLLVNAQGHPSFDRGSFISTKGDTLPYRILFPVNFDPTKKYPLILVLHGAGERGNNNESQLIYGTQLFMTDTIRQKYAAIVIYPQCPANSYWSNVKIEPDSATKKLKFIFQKDGPPTAAMRGLLGLVDEFLDKPYVNKHKVYVGGLSMGGMGTFELIGRKPNVFAAAFAICGGDNTLNAKKYAKKVPVWVFHGQKDSVVPYEHSESIVAAIKEAGGTPKYTLYPNDDHNSWNDAFKEPDLIPWLFTHTK
ncbi:prolyl oligopeptidase family serine peptidase [Mucilaginibacter sp.]|uniref:carboxylesterase family protein n=1 Tax=Mucilaginibacter sp. TaxID=1882438 RepID=UPI003D135898